MQLIVCQPSASFFLLNALAVQNALWVGCVLNVFDGTRGGMRSTTAAAPATAAAAARLMGLTWANRNRQVDVTSKICVTLDTAKHTHTTHKTTSKMCQLCVKTQRQKTRMQFSANKQKKTAIRTCFFLSERVYP